MGRTVEIAGKELDINWTITDRIVNWYSPAKGNARFQVRAMTAIAGGGYLSGKNRQNTFRNHNPGSNSPDIDINSDLHLLRGYTRDLARRCPIATGALSTANTNVVGTGLKFQSRIDRTVINFKDDAEADALEAKIEREFALFTKDCDIRRTLSFGEIQALVFRSALDSGDCLTIMPYKKTKGSLNPYGLKLQIIEADRLCNPDNKQDSDKIAQGIERDIYGAPTSYYVANHHPGNYRHTKDRTWSKIDAFSKNGRRKAIHLYRMLRPDQSRGVPYIAPVIELLKKLGDYTEAELKAALVSGLYTVFIKTEAGESEFNNPNGDGTTSDSSDAGEQNLGNGAIIDLAHGESIETASPGRPNTAFDPFVTAIIRQIGVALELPFEILVKHFTSSYSASQAALLEAWKFFSVRRHWLVENFCNPVFEAWMDEAVAIGRIPAPGYFTDPIIRQAYLKSGWIGPGRGMIKSVEEVKGAKGRVDMGISTLADEAAAQGKDFETVYRQRKKEKQMMVEAGLEAAVFTPAPSGDDTGDNDTDPDIEDDDDNRNGKTQED